MKAGSTLLIFINSIAHSTELELLHEKTFHHFSNAEDSLTKNLKDLKISRVGKILPTLFNLSSIVGSSGVWKTQTLPGILVRFHVPTMFFLHLLLVLAPIDTVFRGCRRHAFVDTAFHAFETANINVSIGFLHQLPHGIGIFF